VSDKSIQKRFPTSIREKGQYLIALGVVAAMLLVANIPIFVIFFFGIFAYLVLKMFAAGSKSDVREIFEFYLSANEILRDDDRKWFGFEINETIEKGESIVRRMGAAPPLVYFTLGALFHKAGNHKSAVNYLSKVVDKGSTDESSYVYPTPELRSYVRVLRKIEREPADAPLTSAAVRALERARRLRGGTLLEASRVGFAKDIPVNGNGAKVIEATVANEPLQQPSIPEQPAVDEYDFENAPNTRESITSKAASDTSTRKRKIHSKDDPYADRKPISEVLHDIYDKNVQ
jgi:hypothetical protein